MAKLITETSYDFQLHEDKSTKDMYIVGIFSTAEMENNNKRKYGRDILEREIGKVQDKIGKNCLWGELGHPPNPEVNPDKIALKIENLEWKGNNVYGKAKLIDTPMGNIAKTLVKEGSMGISSRGLGTVSESGYVNEDFNLITYDLVTDPSNKGSWMNGIYEGKEFEIKSNSMDNVSTEKSIKEAQKAYAGYIIELLENLSNPINEMKSANKTTIKVLMDLLEWAKGNRGSKSGNPYGIPEVKAALQHLADLQGIKTTSNSEWMDAKTTM
jgi:hypothetical protein